MRKWAKAFQREGRARAQGRKCCRTDYAGTKGPERSEIGNEAKRLKLQRFLTLSPRHSGEPQVYNQGMTRPVFCQPEWRPGKGRETQRHGR